MDWSKAKTILIVAFIITNLLLVYFIFEEKAVTDPMLKEDFIEKVTELLEDSNIKISINIPNFIPKLNTITVNYEEYDIDSVNKKFLDGESKVEFLKESVILKNENKKVVLEEKGISYEDKSKNQKIDDLNKEKALEISRDFLLEKGYRLDDLSEGFVEKNDNIFNISYSKLYDNKYVESTYTKFKIDEYGIREFNRLWLEIKDKGDKEIQIGPASKAILDLIGNEKFYGREITDISLCYYFKPVKDIKDIIDMEIEGKEGKAGPAWRIEFDNGERYIVE